MPLTLKTAAMKYKNANGEYVGVNAIAEETTAEAVADIQAESATQQAAIEAKGAETRASIPADYTTLSDDVTDLKGAMLLEQDEIPDTVQSIVFDGSGNVQSITHKKRTDQSVTVRTDAFAFTGNLITEVRTLASGETLTIVTDTDTLVTTLTYAAA